MKPRSDLMSCIPQEPEGLFTQIAEKAPLLKQLADLLMGTKEGWGTLSNVSGVHRQTMYDVCNRKDLKTQTAVKLLEAMGYELVIQKKEMKDESSQSYRRND